MRAEDADGLIPEAVGVALRDMASTVPADQAIVEIGSFKGRSTCYLASGAKAGLGAHVFAVDPWDLPGNETGRFGFADPKTRQAFKRQIRDAGLQGQVTAIRGFSVDVAVSWHYGPIGLLFIDGDHSEQAVFMDYTCWKQHLAADAIVAFDDLNTPKNPGVRAALEALKLDFAVVADRLAVVNG